MTQKQLIIIFCAFQVVCAGIYIYQYSTFISLQRKEQQQEQVIQQLQIKKQQLVYELSMLQDPEKIKTFAQKELGMRPMRLTQVKSISLPNRGSEYNAQ